MTSFVKAAGLAGILVVILATVTPELKAAQPNNAVREGQPVVTELSATAWRGRRSDSKRARLWRKPNLTATNFS